MSEWVHDCFYCGEPCDCEGDGTCQGCSICDAEATEELEEE